MSALTFQLITRRTYNPDVAMAFEEQYEKELQLTEPEKRELSVTRLGTWGVYLLNNDEIIGETHGIEPCRMGSDFEIEDCDPHDRVGVYCYGTTLRPEWQGRGLGRLLKTYWMGLLAGNGYRATYGHATSPAMFELVRSLGAVFGPEHNNWQGSKRIARFYTIPLGK